MATLAITAAVNIGVGLLLNYLFAPSQPNVSQTGPRLDDLSVTSSAYGRNRHLGYGTARLNGNIFWSSGIEEVVTTTTQSGGGKGGGGGGSVSSTTYSYFASFAIGFATRTADKLLRVWADNKLIYDATGTSEVISKFTIKFYKGDGNHLIDPLIEADIDGQFGAGSTPAYNDEVFFVANRWSLADFGNRIPNITAEIAFKGTDTLPYLGLTELPGHDIPGSLTGATSGNGTALDPFSNRVYFLKMNANGAGIADSFAMTDINLISDSGLDDRTLFWSKDGYIYGQFDSSNGAPFSVYEPVSAVKKGQFGVDTALDNKALPFHFPNGTRGGVLYKEFPGSPISPVKYLVFSFGGSGGGGFSVYKETSPGAAEYELTDLTPDTVRGLDGGYVIPNMFTDEIYWIQETSTNIEIFKGTAVIDIGLFGPETSFEYEIVVQATKASLGFAAQDIKGWIILPNENAIILGTGIPTNGSMVKFDLDTWAVLGSRQDFGFSAKYEFATAGRWATPDSGEISSNNLIYTIDTDTLETTETVRIDAGAFAANEDSALNPSASYDPRSHSVIFSRQYLSTFTPPSGERVVKVFLGRATGFGEPLSSVVSDLCSRAGLAPSDIDVTDLISDTMRGYVVSRVGPYRAAIEPLQRAFLFDGVESDWKVKFIKRGGSTALTIAEDDIGRLGQDERIEEKRIQEVELPEKVVLQYSDADKDYEPGTAYDKRVTNPTPSQFALNEVQIELPLVMTPTEAKKLASSALYTTWAERLTMDSTLPWRYIRLDPTDVADMIFRGETRQIRMGEIEVGADLSLDFTAVQEDVSTYVSTLTGTGGDGFTQQVPFGGLPSKFIPMNLPLLSAADATLLTSNKVYYGVAGYETNWPGATIFRSLDAGVSYLQVSAASTECSWGSVVTTIPSIWDVVDANNVAYSRKVGGPGGFTWDDANTIDVVPFRGADRWTTSTDTEVLNGDNAMAVIKADGTCEIIQFVNVASVNASTIRLSRLLRGRRGTEDYARGFTGGETCVLLETGRIEAFLNDLSFVNVSTPFKAVTAGTLIEDALQQNFAGNGEDLRPYSVVNLEVTRAGSVTTIWERRTRFNGELVDGMGTVPLNEEGEFYDVEYYLPNAAAPFLTRENLTAKTDTLTVAEFEAATSLDADQLAFDNWDFETTPFSGPPADWVRQLGSHNWQSTAGSIGALSGPHDGVGYAFTSNSLGNVSNMTTDRKYLFSEFGHDADFLDSGPTITIDCWLALHTHDYEEVEAQLRIYSSSDTLIQTISSGVFTGSIGTWSNEIGSAALVSGARKFDVHLIGGDGVGIDAPEGAVDTIKVLLGEPTDVPPVDIKIYQKSQQVGRGKATRQRI